MLFAIVIKGTVYYKVFQTYDFLSSVENKIYLKKMHCTVLCTVQSYILQNISFCVKKESRTGLEQHSINTLFFDDRISLSVI